MSIIFDAMCSELRRIFKSGGLLIGSFNLDEKASVTEPQTLTEEKLKYSLLKDFEIISYRMAKHGPAGNNYKHFYDGSAPVTEGPRYLWLKAQKPE